MNGATDPPFCFVDYTTMEEVAQQAVHLSRGALPTWQK